MAMTGASSLFDSTVDGPGAGDAEAIGEETLLLDTSRASPCQDESQPTTRRLAATCWCAWVMGANTAAYGALIPHIEAFYGKSHGALSTLVFVLPFSGYVLSTVMNNRIYQSLGWRGVSLIGPGCHLVAFAAISLHPPFTILAALFMLIGFGNGTQNAAWNVWIGTLDNSHQALGFFHGFYGLGAMISPIVTTSLVTRFEWAWYSFYNLMAGAAMIELVSLASAFWKETGPRDQQEQGCASLDTSKSPGGNTTRLSLTHWATWICSGFLFLCGGIEISVGGWIVVFMRNVRHSSLFISGMTETGFFLGMTIGRFVLGFISPLIGERMSMSLYLLLMMLCELLFWVVPHSILSVVAITFMGFFMGPIYPTVMVAAMQLLPEPLHVAAIGFICVVGEAGGAFFSFLVGSIAETKGVEVLLPILLSLLNLALGTWAVLCKMSTSKRRVVDQTY